MYIPGWSAGKGTNSDYITIKYDDNGNKKCVKSYNGRGKGLHQATAIAVGDDGNVYITAFSTGSGTDFDFATIKRTTSLTPLFFLHPAYTENNLFVGVKMKN